MGIGDCWLWKKNLKSKEIKCWGDLFHLKETFDLWVNESTNHQAILLFSQPISWMYNTFGLLKSQIEVMKLCFLTWPPKYNDTKKKFPTVGSTETLKIKLSIISLCELVLDFSNVSRYVSHGSKLQVQSTNGACKSGFRKKRHDVSNFFKRMLPDALVVVGNDS